MSESPIDSAANEATPQISTQPSEPAIPSGETIYYGLSWLQAVQAVILSLVVSLIVLTGYRFWFAPKPTIAQIDLSEVLDIRQMQLAQILARPAVSDEDRIRAGSMVSGMNNDLDKALRDLQTECGCTLLVKNAVIAGAPQDLTASLKHKLGMDTIDVAALRMMIQAQVAGAKPAETTSGSR